MTARNTRRIVFVEQFYYPEGWGGAQLPRDTTIRLAGAGFEVDVICGSDQYAPTEGQPIPDPRNAGVNIRRIPRLLSGDVHRLKFLRQLWFYAAAVPLLLLGRRPAAFICQTNPPLVVPLVAFVAWVRRVALIVIAQDLYPEVVIASELMRKDSFWARLLRQLFSWAYRRADSVVSLGPVMSQRLMAKGVARERIEEIANWATGDLHIVRDSGNPLRVAWKLEGKVVLLYSGNLGIAHDIDTPLRALSLACQHVSNFVLLFIGKGSRLADAKRLAKEYGVDQCVQFRPFVPLEQLPQSLGLASAALVTLSEGFEGLVVPSKVLGYMARGVPTIYVGPPSDIGMLLSDSAGGICVANHDAESLAGIMRELASNPRMLELAGVQAANYYARHLNQGAGLAKYEALVSRIVDPGQAAQPMR